jgi:hypothetical protein
MTLEKEWYISYQHLTLLIIYIGDAEYQAIDKGIIQIERKNGNTKNIHDVLHVPNLAKNLIFVSRART